MTIREAAEIFGWSPREVFSVHLLYVGHVGVANDEARRRDNQLHDPDLMCPRCEATGNQLMGMHQKCEDCGGTGLVKIDSKDIH